VRLSLHEGLRKLPRLMACLLGLVILYSAFAKAGDPERTLWALRSVFENVPPIGIDARDAVFILVALEVFMGVLLLSGIFPRAASLLVLVMLGVFTSRLAYLAITGSALSCGCGIDAGWLFPGSERVGNIVRNVLLAAMAVASHPSASKYFNTACQYLHRPRINRSGSVS